MNNKQVYFLLYGTCSFHNSHEIRGIDTNCSFVIWFYVKLLTVHQVLVMLITVSKTGPFSPLICKLSLSIPCNPLGLSPVIGYSMHDQDNPCCNQFSSILVSWEKLMFFCGLHHKLYRGGLSSGDLRTLMLWCKTEVEKFTMNLSDHISRQKANMGT